MEQAVDQPSSNGLSKYKDRVKPAEEHQKTQEIHPQPEINDFKDTGLQNSVIKCFKNMSLKTKILIGGLITVFIALVVALPIIFVDINPGIRSTPIIFGDSQVMVNSIQAQKGKHKFNIFSMHLKALESVCPTTGAVTKMLESVNGSQIEFVVPLMVMLQYFNNTSKFNETYSEWLQDFSANPRHFTDKLIEKIKLVLSKKYTYKNGQKIVDNLTLKSIKEDTLVYVQYIIAEKVFKVSKWGSETVTDQKAQSTTNLKAQTQTLIQTDDTPKSADGTSKDETIQAKDKNDQRDSTVNKEDLIARVMQNTIWSIKRTAARNIQALRAKGEELIKYQENFVKDNSISQEWQKVLIQDCKIISNTKFKCSLQRIQKLVPDVTSETIKASNDYVVENAFKLVFQENVEKSA